MPRPVSSPPSPPKGTRLGLSGWLTTLAILWVMFWFGVEGDDIGRGYVLTGQKQDYYNLLVDGFLNGHLSMEVAPDASGDPPYLLDASLYRGKYYLYFGVTPAVTTFLPYAYLTGHDLPSNAAVLVFTVLGFLLNLRLYLLARSRYFPGLSPAWHVCSLLLIAFGSGTPILLMDGGFYEVAIAAGYLFLSAMLLCLYQAIHDETRLTIWLGLASLAGGFAVGCRPTYLLVLPILLGPVAVRLRQKSRSLLRTNLLVWLGAAILPAALVGVLLMTYNYGRFGDPLEFGFKYQVNELMRSGMPFARAAFVWPNLTWYYFTPPVISPYFPYALPIAAAIRPPDYYGYELIHGQWIASMLGLCCTGMVIWLRYQRRVWPKPFVLFALLTASAFAILLLTTATFGFRANRYVVDFQGTLIVLLVFIAGGCAALGSFSRLFRHLFTPLFCLLAVGLAVFNLLVGIQWMDRLANTRPKTYRQLAYYGNYPSHWLHQLSEKKYGSYRFRVRFAPEGKSVQEPLFTTGTNSYTDILYVIQHANGQAEFTIDHLRYGGIRSDLMAVDFAAEHEMEVAMGSLYPPLAHPFFKDWAPADALRIKNSFQVRLDKKIILNGNQKFYDAPPSAVYFGVNPDSIDRLFSGEIHSIEPVVIPLKELSESGVWRLQTTFPPFSGQGPQPLLASGYSGHGNLLCVDYIDPQTIRLGLDEWGAGISFSDPIPLDYGAPHRIEVFVGPQVAAQTLPAEWELSPTKLKKQASQLRILMDGHLVWDTPIHVNQDSYNAVSIGYNPQGFSSATTAFSGTIKNEPLSPEETKDLIVRSLATTPAPPPAD